MKLQIEISDKEKIVRVEDSVNVGELFNFLQAHFTNDLWKEFTLEVKPIVQWSQPIIIEKQFVPLAPYPAYPNPWGYPWWLYPTTCGSNAKTFSVPAENYQAYGLDSGIYCVEVK